MKKGFTLIELLMVVALIAIVSTLAVNRLGGVRESASRKISLANQKSVERAVEAYLAEGGRLNRLDSLIYASGGGAPIFGSSADGSIDYSNAASKRDLVSDRNGDGTDPTDVDWLYLGPKEDDPDGKYRDQFNSGLTVELRKILCKFTLSAAQVASLDSHLGLRYVMAHTAYADAGDRDYPSKWYGKDRPYGDGTVPNASDGLDANDSACVATILTNKMTVAAINPMIDLGRVIYQACGQELMSTKNWGEQYSESEVMAEIAANGGPLLAFGLGDSASIVGKSDAGIESAPYATYVNKKFYSRYIILIRLKTIGSGSVSQIVPEFAGVLDCCGNTVRGAQHVIKRM